MKSILATALLIGVIGFSPKPAAKTYYYFCYSRGWDSNNESSSVGTKSTVLLTSIQSAESVDGDLLSVARSWGALVKSECANENGCTSDLNLFPTKEQAIAAHDGIRMKYAHQPQFILKEVSFELKKFKIVIEKNEEGIMLKSEEGSAWEKLSFSLNNYRPQAVDGNGMTVFTKDPTGKYLSSKDFLFTITKTNDGILLKGIKGTAWAELSFTLNDNQPQSIDQNGMTK